MKNFVIKMKSKIKEKDKIINDYAKIINGTKKEYQKLHAENIQYRDKFKQQQGHNQQKYERQMREKELYEKKRKRDKRYIFFGLFFLFFWSKTTVLKTRSKKVLLLLRK